MRNHTLLKRPDIIAKVREHLSVGNTALNTSRLLGISEETYYAWLREARKIEAKVERGETLDETEEAVLRFSESVKAGKRKP